MALTIIDIARLSGTSKSTVSRYLNHGSVSASSAKKIKKAIEQTHFQKNAAASTLKGKNSKLIGVLLDFESFGSTDVAEALRGIDTQLRKESYRPFITLNKVDNSETIQNIRFMLSQKIDGLILGISNRIDKDLAPILSLPTVAFVKESHVFPSVVINNVQAGEKLAEYANQQNIEHALFLSMAYDKTNLIVDRLTGLKNKANFSIDFLSGKTLPELVNKTENFIKSAPYSIDAIIGASDKIAFTLQQHLIENGIEVPQQIKTAGFGNSPYTTLVSPQLTSVDMSFFEVGTRAAKNVIKLLNQKEVAPTENDFKIKVISRKSM